MKINPNQHLTTFTRVITLTAFYFLGGLLGALLFALIDGVPFGFFTFGTAIGNTAGAVICTTRCAATISSPKRLGAMAI